MWYIILLPLTVTVALCVNVKIGSGPGREMSSLQVYLSTPGLLAAKERILLLTSLTMEIPLVP